jgi:hypothetical protein
MPEPSVICSANNSVLEYNDQGINIAIPYTVREDFRQILTKVLAPHGDRAIVMDWDIADASTR